MSILIVQVFEKPTEVTVLLSEFEAATFGQSNTVCWADFPVFLLKIAQVFEHSNHIS